jgi:hypothetical protein
VEIRTNLDSLFGWWQSVQAADLDGDGKDDLILGNIGENFYLHPDSTQPVKLWINDFDQNGIVEKVITKTVKGKDVPVFLKRDLTDQMVTLKKQNLRYAEFAKKSIDELFPAEQIKKAEMKLFNYNSSCIAYNQGNAKFKVSVLPMELQFSSVNAILCTDINNDHKPDIILGGNMFGFLPQFSRLDASFGHILLNKGDGSFELMPPGRSGLELRGEIKDIKEIKTRASTFLLFLQNNDYPVIYRLDKSAKGK